jgi:hypothetical protein
VSHLRLCIVGSSDFILRDSGRHWKLLNREETQSNVCFEKNTLAAT